MFNRVEDEFSGEPFDPAAWMTQDRTHPPHKDNARLMAGFPDVTRLRSRGYNSFIGANGAIEIQDMVKRLLLTEARADGKGAWDR